MNTSEKSVATGKHRQTPCAFCQGINFTWGKLHAQGLRFLPTNKSQWSFPWINLPQARRCDTCGNIQLFDTLPNAEEELF